MRFIKRNLKYLLPALIVFFVIVAAIANTSIRGVKEEQKKAMEALNPVEIGEEEILTQRETAIESGTAETERVLEKKEQTNHKEKVTREDKKEGEEETKGNKEGQQKEGQQKEDSKKNSKTIFGTSKTRLKVLRFVTSTPVSGLIFLRQVNPRKEKPSNPS